jgi:hypothetical protein
MNSHEAADLLPPSIPPTRCIKPLHPSHTSSATSVLIFFILPLPMCDRGARASSRFNSAVRQSTQKSKTSSPPQALNKLGHEDSH